MAKFAGPHFSAAANRRTSASSSLRRLRLEAFSEHLITIFVLDARDGGGGRTHHADTFGRRLQQPPERRAARERFFFIACRAQ